MPNIVSTVHLFTGWGRCESIHKNHRYLGGFYVLGVGGAKRPMSSAPSMM